MEITNCSALPTSFYCRIFGDRGALECSEMNIHYRHLPVDFQWTEAVVDAAPHAGEVHFSPPDRIEWIDEHEVIQAGSGANGMMDYSAWRKVIEECEFAEAYRAIQEEVPYPVKNREALEVLEIMCKIKERNPQFQWVK